MLKRLYKETFPHLQKMAKIKKCGNVSVYRRFPHFQKMYKIKKCGNGSIYRHFHICNNKKKNGQNGSI